MLRFGFRGFRCGRAERSAAAAAALRCISNGASCNGPYVDALHWLLVEMPLQDLEMTPRMADIIKVFLEDPSRPRYGLELMRLTGQPSGSVYPNLAKFEGAKWLVGGKEDIDPRVEGRPPRRFYRIAGAAVPVARLKLAALSDRFRPPSVVPHRLTAPEGVS